MSKILVAYFSASGVTARAAQAIAAAVGGDLYEIAPAQPYTAADLDWTNKQSRSSLEMGDTACRPALAAAVENVEQYDTVFVGDRAPGRGHLPGKRRLLRQSDGALFHFRRQRHAPGRAPFAGAVPRPHLEGGPAGDAPHRRGLGPVRLGAVIGPHTP